MLHMLGINIGDNGDGGGQPIEGTVTFIGLDHHPFALPHTRVRSIGVNDTTIDHRGVKLTGIQQRRHHRGRGGFAMGTRNRDIRFQPHQFSQHFSPAHHRQTA